MRKFIGNMGHSEWLFILVALAVASMSCSAAKPHGESSSVSAPSVVDSGDATVDANRQGDPRKFYVYNTSYKPQYETLSQSEAIVYAEKLLSEAEAGDDIVIKVRGIR